MRTRWRVVIGAVAIAMFVYAVQRGIQSRSTAFAEPELHALLASGLERLQGALAKLDATVASADRKAIHAAFRLSRKQYKYHEALVASAAPSMAGILNGPLPEDDDDPNQPIGAPAAFQRIEARIFSNDTLTTASRAEMHTDVVVMQKAIGAARELEPHFPLTETNVLEALRTQLARISTLALAGMDSHESGDAIVESAYALDGLRDIARTVEGGGVRAALWRALADTLEVAAGRLRADSNFVTSNRLRFVAIEAAAVGRSLGRLRDAQGSIDDAMRLVWRSRATTLFERNAFDASAYAPAIAMQPTPQLLALGSRLFHEVKLSGPGTRSCATCHTPDLAFTDGLVRHPAMGIHRGVLARNTPTLLNVGLQPAFFADARVTTLEEQIGVVLASSAEMGSSVESAARKLSQDKTYRAAFGRVVPSDAGASVTDTLSAISEALLRNVLAAYVRSLVRLDSRFDAAIAGDTNALSAGERRGFTLFMGKGRCGTCHFAPLFSGVTPPGFSASEAEIIGVPLRADTISATIDPDAGRSAIDSIQGHRHAFSVPTLRNIARTAPYMHNGAYATLEQVVDFYNRGGGLGIGADVPAQTLSAAPLELSSVEQADLLAFLKSLTDRAFDR